MVCRVDRQRSWSPNDAYRCGVFCNTRRVLLCTSIRHTYMLLTPNRTCLSYYTYDVYKQYWVVWVSPCIREAAVLHTKSAFNGTHGRRQEGQIMWSTSGCFHLLWDALLRVYGLTALNFNSCRADWTYLLRCPYGTSTLRLQVSTYIPAWVSNGQHGLLLFYCWLFLMMTLHQSPACGRGRKPQTLAVQQCRRIVG